MPGGSIDGIIECRGGSADFEVRGVNLEMQARAEYEDSEGRTQHTWMDYSKIRVSGGFTLSPGSQQSLSTGDNRQLTGAALSRATARKPQRARAPW